MVDNKDMNETIVALHHEVKASTLVSIGMLLIAGGISLALTRAPLNITIDGTYASATNTSDIFFGYQTPTYATYATSTAQDIYNESTLYGSEHKARVQAFRPQVVRFPDGTPANFYDWETETFSTITSSEFGNQTGCGGNSRSADRNCIRANQSAYIQLFRTISTIPLFVLNVEQRAGNNLLQWVNVMNNDARPMKVKWWELGNELFWAKPQGWVTPTTKDDPRCAQFVPPPTNAFECDKIAHARYYVNRAASAGQAILANTTYRTDPQFRVVATMMGPMNVLNRSTSTAAKAHRTMIAQWNNLWDKVVKNNAPQNFYNAVSVHSYFSATDSYAKSRTTQTSTEWAAIMQTLHNDEVRLMRQNVNWYMQAGDEYPNQLAEWASLYVPQHMPIQITELGIESPGSWQPYWGYGISELNAILQLIANHKNDAKNYNVEAIFKHLFCYTPSPGTSAEYAQGNLSATTCAKETPGWANGQRIDGVNAIGEIHTFLLDALHDGGIVQKMDITEVPTIAGMGGTMYEGKTYPGAVVFRFKGLQSTQTRHIVVNRQDGAFRMTLPARAGVKYTIATYAGANGLTTYNRAMTIRRSAQLSPNAVVDVPGNSVILIQGIQELQSMLGDVNGSGTITASDALMVLKLAVGQSVAGAQADRADVDCSGEVTTTDALLILKTAVGQLAQPMTCTASQSAGVAQVFVSTTGTGVGAIIPGTPVRVGSEYRLSFVARPVAGSRFVGWEGVCTGARTTCRFITSGAMSQTAKARFELK